MRVFIALLKREWLEHKRMFLWIPALIAVFMLLGFWLTSIAAGNIDITSTESYTTIEDGVPKQFENRTQMSMAERWQQHTQNQPGSSAASESQLVANALASTNFIFYIALQIVTFFVLANSTYDERHDGSILFYKSLPVSDTTTLASKFVLVAWIAPLATITAMLTLVAVTMASIKLFNFAPIANNYQDLSLANYLAQWPSSLVVTFLQSLWALPVYGWILLLGCCAKRGVLLWAIGIPWLLVWLEKQMFKTTLLSDSLIAHVLPGTHLPYHQFSSLEPARAALANLISWNFLLGLLIGVGLLLAAAQLRKRNNQI